MKNQLIQNQNIWFITENLPYSVRAINTSFAVCTRKFDKKEDSDLVKHKVKTGAYSSKGIAREKMKNDYVYSIIDFHNNIRGAHNMIFNPYDFGNPEDMQSLIKDLESGDTEISHRNQCALDIDWTKTTDKPF